MIFVRRRRPLMRAAVVGGGAYAVGRRHAGNAQREEEQEERLNELETQQSGQKGGNATPGGPDIASRLSDLAQLKDSGMITEEEFEAAKKKLLS